MSTPYPAVNDVVGTVLSGAREVLGPDLIGFYLDGSLALGDFDRATSDVDFIAAIARPLSPPAFAVLADMHRQLRDSGRPFAGELEGSYIPLPALRRHDPADATFANHERGPEEVLKYKYHHSDWVIHRHVVREHGVALYGPPPDSLIAPVAPDELRAATADLLRSWWGTPEAAQAIADAHPSYLAYVVQTMCRALHTLEIGLTASKPVACCWALGEVSKSWQPLIESALRGHIDLSLRKQTAEFVRLVTELGERQLWNDSY